MQSSEIKPKKRWLPFSLGTIAALCALLLLGAVCYADGDGGNESWHAGQPAQAPAALQVPGETNTLAFHATGIGVQIYVWTQSATDPTQFSWVLKAPHAVLTNHREGIVGIHFGGPTWQGNDGSKVVAARVASATVNSNAIPWLLLKATSTTGVGDFAGITYIQRLNTGGGLAPSTPGSSAGQEALAPYVAEYYFYRAN
jgi:hypothetical protein